MNSLFPSYRRLPLSTPLIALALMVLLIAVWVQSGDISGLHLLFLITSYITWGLLLPFIQGIVISITYDLKGIFTAIVRGLMIIVLHFVASNIIFYTLQYFLVDPFTPPSIITFKQILVPAMLGRVAEFVLFFGLQSWIQRGRELNENQLKLVNTEKNLQKMRLKSLQSQLNPHFLFNTLHTISSLIGRNDDKAREVTIRISSLLRKVLASNELDSYRLENEIDLIRDYLDIEQERFNDRLTIVVNIDEGASEVIVPTLILQPLIENAIKHGISKVEGESILTVLIKLNEQRNNLYFEVTNDIPKEPSSLSASTGIGLSNLKERLNAYYKQKIVISANKTEDLSFRVTFTVPIEE